MTSQHITILPLSYTDICDLRMLRQELLGYQPTAFNKCERARDAVRYLALVEKLLSTAQQSANNSST